MSRKDRIPRIFSPKRSVLPASARLHLPIKKVDGPTGLPAIAAERTGHGPCATSALYSTPITASTNPRSDYSQATVASNFMELPLQHSASVCDFFFFSNAGLPSHDSEPRLIAHEPPRAFRVSTPSAFPQPQHPGPIQHFCEGTEGRFALRYTAGEERCLERLKSASARW